MNKGLGKKNTIRLNSQLIEASYITFDNGLKL